MTSGPHVEIPEGTLSTTGNQFSYNETLLSVNLPKSMLTIASATFEECKNLKEINFPNGLRKIQEYAFSHCESLTSVDIPSSVILINMFAFDNCSYPDLTVRFLATPKRTNTLRICQYAFYECFIKELVIPENCQLEIMSFGGCKLERIAIPLNYHYTPESRDEILNDMRGNQLPHEEGPSTIGKSFGTQKYLREVKFYGSVYNREQTMEMLLQWHEFKNVTFIFDNAKIMELLRNEIAARIDSGQGKGFFEGAVLRLNNYSSFDDVKQNAFSGEGAEEYIDRVFKIMGGDYLYPGMIDGTRMEITKTSEDIMLPTVKAAMLPYITVPAMTARAEPVERPPELSGSKVLPRPEPVDVPPTKRQAFGTK